GLRFLLDALATLGYLARDGTRYWPTRMTRRWLPALETGAGFAEQLLYSEEWHHLEDHLRDEQAVKDPYSDPSRNWREFKGGMVAYARVNAMEVVNKVKLPRGAARLIDVGGGHGVYAMEFCRRYPHLAA